MTKAPGSGAPVGDVALRAEFQHKHRVMTPESDGMVKAILPTRLKGALGYRPCVSGISMK